MTATGEGPRSVEEEAFLFAEALRAAVRARRPTPCDTGGDTDPAACGTDGWQAGERGGPQQSAWLREAPMTLRAAADAADLFAEGLRALADVVEYTWHGGDSAQEDGPPSGYRS